MGIPGLFLTGLTGIGHRIILQKTALTRNDLQTSGYQLFPDHGHFTAAYITNEFFLRQGDKDLLYRKTGSQLVHRPLRLAGMCRHEDRFFRRLRRLWILLRFCFIENTDLIRHDIVLLLAGRTEAGTLRVEQEFIHSLELLAQIPVFLFQCIVLCLQLRKSGSVIGCRRICSAHLTPPPFLSFLGYIVP